MNSCFATLLSAALTVHAVMGCCWRHVDACGGRDWADARALCPQSTVDGDACEGDTPCCHRHAGKPAKTTRGHAPPCGCQLECSGTCRFLPASERVQVDRPAASFAVAVIPTGPAVSALAQSAIQCQDLPRPGRGAGLPVRLHLAHQLLLI